MGRHGAGLHDFLELQVWTTSGNMNGQPSHPQHPTTTEEAKPAQHLRRDKQQQTKETPNYAYHGKNLSFALVSKIECRGDWGFSCVARNPRSGDNLGVVHHLRWRKTKTIAQRANERAQIFTFVS